MLSRDEIKAAVKEALSEEIAPLYVDRETHYKDHLFIKGLRELLEDTKGTVWGAFLRVIVYSVLVLLLGGLAWWTSAHIRQGDVASAPQPFNHRTAR